MEELSGIIILANTELDSCLAAGLFIENINCIPGIEYIHPYPADEFENFQDDEEYLEDELEHFFSHISAPKKHLPIGSIIFNINNGLDICFISEESVISNSWKIVPGHALVVIIGYSDSTLQKIKKTVLKEGQEYLDLGNVCSTFSLADFINWGAKLDHSVNVRVAASIIWESEFLMTRIDKPLVIGKKMRKEAERIINCYQDTLKVAYSLYSDDPKKMNIFFVELMNEHCNKIDSLFIDDMMENEEILTKNTLAFSKRIINKGDGIGFLNVGRTKVFKYDILLGMDYYYCRVLEYLDKDLKSKTLTLDFTRTLSQHEGPFIKNDLINKN